MFASRSSTFRHAKQGSWKFFGKSPSRNGHVARCTRMCGPKPQAARLHTQWGNYSLKAGRSRQLHPTKLLTRPLARSFHHTARKDAFPVVKVLAFGLGRGMKRIVDKYPRSRRYIFGIFGTLFVVLPGMYLWAHYEVNPVTGNYNLQLLNNLEMVELGNLSSEFYLEEYGAKIVHPSHPRAQQIASEVAVLTKNPAAKYLDLEWRTFLIGGDEPPNLFVLPNGHIFVSENMMIALGDEPNALGILLGHEVAHVICRHISVSEGRTVVGVWFATFAQVAMSFLFGDVLSYIAVSFFGDTALEFSSLPYSRRDEMEADTIGLLLAAECGFDVRLAPAIWEAMAYLLPEIEGLNFLSTHPSHAARAENCLRLLPEVLEGLGYSEDEALLDAKVAQDIALDVRQRLEAAHQLEKAEQAEQVTA